MILLEDFTVEILHAGNIFKRICVGRECRQGDPDTLIPIRTAKTVKPFKLTYKLNPFNTALCLCLCRIRYQLSSYLLSLTAGLQVVESNVFGA